MMMMMMVMVVIMMMMMMMTMTTTTTMMMMEIMGCDRFQGEAQIGKLKVPEGPKGLSRSL
jgi:hypothetical protein